MSILRTHMTKKMRLLSINKYKQIDMSITCMMLALIYLISVQTTCQHACIHSMSDWVSDGDIAVYAKSACSKDAACTAHVLGSQSYTHELNIRTLLRNTEYGDVLSAICATTETSLEERLMALWLTTSMLSRRDLCPRGMEHVVKPSTQGENTTSFACECLPGNPCESYYETIHESDFSNIEKVLSWTTCISTVLMLLLGFVRFVVLYNRTVPHIHTHMDTHTKK